MRTIILSSLLAATLPLMAQKKVVPVTNSPLTGISLPAGSKQDSRGLMTMSARVLLEMESKKSGSSIGETEVLALPAQTSSGYSADSLMAALTARGWTVTPVENDEKFAWLQKDNVFLIAYFSLNKNSTDLYFGKANNPPALAGTMPASGADAGGGMALPPDAGNNPPADAGSLPPATDPSISGTWYTSSVLSNNITHSYIKKQYSFNNDGSYTFYKKTFDISWSFSLLTRESGTYTFNGSQLTLHPASCVTEKWSKKDRADQWGSLLSTEKRKLEQGSYQVSKQYFGSELNLILSIPQPTERDGAYSVNSSFPNSYFYAPPPSNDYLIDLPGNDQAGPEVNPPPVISPNGYSFSVTNWDDGWTSSVQENWVEVKKGTTRVLLHFKKDESVFPSNSSERTGPAWDLYVAPRYSNLRNFKSARVNECMPLCYIGSATVTENASNREVFVVLFQQNGNWTEVITPDKQSFISQFNFDPEAINTWSDAQPLKAIDNLRNYNKFAVSLADINGDWTGGDFAAMNYFNAYNGSYAGMSAVAMSDEFVFSSNGTYSSTHKGASGMVGNMKTYQQEYKGKVAVSNWEIQLSNRAQGATYTYYAYFEAVRGGRILHLQDKNASAMWYHLVKKTR